MSWSKQWVVNSCFAGSLVLYLCVKVYYENEVKKAARLVDPGCDCPCCRGQSALPSFAAAPSARGDVSDVPRWRPPARLPSHRVLRQDQGRLRSALQRRCGQC